MVMGKRKEQLDLGDDGNWCKLNVQIEECNEVKNIVNLSINFSPRPQLINNRNKSFLLSDHEKRKPSASAERNTLLLNPG